MIRSKACKAIAMTGLALRIGERGQLGIVSSMFAVAGCTCDGVIAEGGTWKPLMEADGSGRLSIEGQLPQFRQGQVMRGACKLARQTRVVAIHAAIAL